MFMKKRRVKLSYHCRMFCDSVIEIIAAVLQSALPNPIQHKEYSVCRGSASVNIRFFFSFSVCYIIWNESFTFYEGLCISNCHAQSQYKIHGEGQCVNNALSCSGKRTCNKCIAQTHCCFPGISLRAIEVKELCIIQCSIDH